VDKTWLGFNVFAAGTAEGNIGIICACAPSLKSCFRVYFKDHFTALGSTIRSKSPWSSEASSGEIRSTVTNGTNESEVSRNTWEALVVPPKDQTVYGGSIKGVKMYESSSGPTVPKEIHRTSMALQSQPSFLYFTDTDDEGLSLSEFPSVPRA